MRTTASTHTGGALFEIGTMAAGYKPIWGVEIRPDIADVAEANIPGLTVIRSDVALVDWSSLERPYHFHSSPSCKNASQANVEAGEVEEDLSSARAICEALRVLEPPTFSLENVWQYRNFESFKLIVRTLRELGYCVDWWHLNAADYSVPQTRKRLILVAAKAFQPRKPQPTHSKTPDMFGVYKPWVGWLEAIADLVDELPESEFAPWQLERLPAELRTLLINGAGNTNFAEAKPGKGCRYPDQPAMTVSTVTKDGGELPKALLLAQGGYDGNVVNRSIDEPSFTVTSNSNQAGIRALLFNKSADKYGDGTVDGESPAFTVVGSSQGRYKAFIVPGDNASNTTVRQEQEPMVTIQSRDLGRCPHRAFVGRVVKLTPRALARLQSVPDTYRLPDKNGLACEIIGNGVACKLAQAIMESIK